MTSEIQRLKALKPDVLFPTSYASDAILMTKTSKDLDFNPPIVMAQNAGHTDPAFYEAMGTDVDGIASRAVYSPDLAEVIPMLKEVEALYRERTKQAGKERSFSDTALRCFVGFFVLADAINRAGSTDPQAIQAALKATNIPKEMLPVPWRGVKFDETGQNILGRAIIVQYQGGKHWVVWPFDLATQDFVYPIRKWAERK